VKIWLNCFFLLVMGSLLPACTANSDFGTHASMKKWAVVEFAFNALGVGV